MRSPPAYSHTAVHRATARVAPYGMFIELGAFIVRAVEDAGPYGTVIEPGACPARRGVVTPPYAQVPIEFRRAA